MTDYPDEIHADLMREKNAREWYVTLTYRMSCTVVADKDATDEELQDLAERAMLLWDTREAHDVELYDAEVVG